MRLVIKFNWQAMLETMTRHLCRNMMKILTFLFITSCAVLCLYWILRNEPEWKEGSELLFGMLCNVAYGFIASYIFFLINVYIPDVQRKRLHISLLADSFARIEYNLEIAKNSYTLSTENKEGSLVFSMSPKTDKPAATSLMTSGPIVLAGYFFDSSEESKIANAIVDYAFSPSTSNTNLNYQLCSPEIIGAVTLKSAADLLDQAIFNGTSLSESFRRYIHGLVHSISSEFRSMSEYNLIMSAKDFNPIQIDVELRKVEEGIKEFYNFKSLPLSFKYYREIHYKRVEKETSERIEDFRETCLEKAVEILKL